MEGKDNTTHDENQTFDNPDSGFITTKMTVERSHFDREKVLITLMDVFKELECDIED